MYSKELVRGTLGTLILQLLETEGRMYGYEIAQKVKEVSKEKILIKEGSLYPILHKLEGEGHLIVEKENIGKRVRKYYSLTPSGKKAAVSKVTELRHFISTLQRFIDPVPGISMSV